MAFEGLGIQMSMLFRERRVGSPHPHQGAHYCLSLQLQGMWLSVLASSGACTHAYIPTRTPFIENKIFLKKFDV